MLIIRLGDGSLPSINVYMLRSLSNTWSGDASDLVVILPAVELSRSTRWWCAKASSNMKCPAHRL